jgi:hypothetical protein
MSHGDMLIRDSRQPKTDRCGDQLTLGTYRGITSSGGTAAGNLRSNEQYSRPAGAAPLLPLRQCSRPLTQRTVDGLAAGAYLARPGVSMAARVVRATTGPVG